MINPLLQNYWNDLCLLYRKAWIQIQIGFGGTSWSLQTLNNFWQLDSHGYFQTTSLQRWSDWICKDVIAKSEGWLFILHLSLNIAWFQNALRVIRRGMRWPQVHIVYRLASPGSRSNICDSSFATGMVIIIIIQRLAWKSCRHLGSSEEFFLRICVFHVIVESSSIHTTGDPSRDFHSSVRPIPFHSLVMLLPILLWLFSPERVTTSCTKITTDQI